MFDFETTVSGIEYRVRLLADEVSGLRKRLSDVEDECHTLQEALKEKEIIINTLKEENKVIKLGNRLSEREDTVEMKLKLNQMIRTIDKSLAMLKKEEFRAVAEERE